LNRMGEMGVGIVIDYLNNRGYKCVDVQKNSKELGCDIVATNKKKKYRIEVKTSQKEKGISDCHSTEFNSKNKFIADFLYIVRLDDKFNLISIDILTKKQINSYNHSRVEKIKLSSTLKTDLFKGNIGESISLK
jgi:Holliday junction resolvase